MRRSHANILLLTSGAIWGAGFVAQSTAMDAIGPFLFIGIRFVFATLTVLPFAIWEARKASEPVSTNSIRAFLMIGLMLFLGMAAQQVGLLTTTVTNSGFLTGLYVVFVPLLTVALLRQRPHYIVWPAAFSAFCGIWLLSGGSLSSLVVGDYLTIICAVFWALQVLMIGKFAGSSGRPLLLATLQFLVCAVLGLAIALPLEPIELTAILAAAPELLFAGIFAGGIAFTLQVIGQRHTTAPQAAIFLSTEALFAALFGVLILSEVIPPIGILGCGLIFAAILAVELVPMWTAKRAHSASGMHSPN